jgi:hypothetical protein
MSRQPCVSLYLLLGLSSYLDTYVKAFSRTRGKSRFTISAIHQFQRPNQPFAVTRTNWRPFRCWRGAHSFHQKARGGRWRFICAILLRGKRAGGTRQ